jgi:non-homologous end joining protein Ku
LTYFSKKRGGGKKDNYVLIEMNDLVNVKLKTTKSMDIKEFVDSKELDPII